MPLNLKPPYPPENLRIGRYIDLLTDFGFKRVFGTEPNKDLLIDLLNSVFQGEKQIVDLVYNKNEHPGDIVDEGSAIFDLTCTCSNGEQIIIEVQRGKPANFRQRAIFYTSHLAAGLAPKGGRKEWNYQLPEIYLIALLEDFSIEEEPNGSYVQRVYLTNKETGKVFYDGLGYIFLELVNFAKKEGELENNLDKWLYVLKNIHSMNRIPVFLRKTIFEKLFSIAEYSKLTKDEKIMYNEADKRRWDRTAVLQQAVQTAREEGIKEGIKEGIEEGKKIASAKAEAEKREEKRQTARILHGMGMPVADIARALAISVEEVQQWI